MLCLLRDHIEVCYAGQDNENFNEESMQQQKFLFNNILYHVGIKSVVKALKGGLRCKAQVNTVKKYFNNHRNRIAIFPQCIGIVVIKYSLSKRKHYTEKYIVLKKFLQKNCPHIKTKVLHYIVQHVQ